MPHKIALILLTFLLPTSLLADLRCGDQIAIKVKLNRDDNRRVIGQRTFMFVFGNLVNDLQDKGFYPKLPVLGSTPPEGLYWHATTEIRRNLYASSVRIANGDGPFYTYLLKVDGLQASLQIWQLSSPRGVNEGVGPDGVLRFAQNFNDCREENLHIFSPAIATACSTLHQ